MALWELQCPEGKLDACAVTVEPLRVPTRPLRSFAWSHPAPACYFPSPYPYLYSMDNLPVTGRARLVVRVFNRNPGAV